MFRLIIVLSRYLFIGYITYFLWQGVCYVAAEREIWKKSKASAVSKQRLVIVFFYITAFLILSYIPGAYAFKTQILVIGGASLLLFLAASAAIDKFFKNGCPLIWNGMFFLSATGLAMLTRLDVELAQKQVVWFFAAFCAAFLIPPAFKIIPKFEKLEHVYLFSGLALLCSTFVFGNEEYGALNWIKIGPMSLQPSEIVKFLFVFYLATVFRKKLTLRQLVFPSAMAAFYVLVLVIQRDLGGALIFFMTYMVVMYISTSSWLLFFGGFLAAAAASSAAYRYFRHVRVRVAAWQNPWADVFDTGNQIVQSLFAIGTWGLLGSGLTAGFPKYVPVVKRDFIFAAICEEFGGIFAIGAIGVYIMVFYRGVNIALRSKRRYYSLLAAGFTAMMAFQSFLILGGTIKLIPLTGVTLPFISYGGSSVLVSTMMIGILQWIYAYYSESRKGSHNE